MTTAKTYDKADFQWWKDKKAGMDLDIYPDQPMTGFYAYRPGGKIEVPLAAAIWYRPDGSLACKVGTKTVDYGLDVWLSSANNPIDHDVYLAVVNGGAWPSEVLVKLSDGKVESSMTKGGIGHNSGDLDKDFLALSENIKEWSDRAKKIKKAGAPKTQAEADTAADVATKLSDLLKEADKKRAEQSKPFLDKQREINATWNKMIEPASPLVGDVKALCLVFDRAERKRRQDAADAANAELAKNAASGAEPPAALVAAPVRMGTRRAVTAVNRSVCEITDIKKLALFMVSMESPPPDIVKALTDQAYKMLRADVAVPGAQLKKVESAR